MIFLTQNLTKLKINLKIKNENFYFQIKKILGPFEQSESFIDSDFSLLENFILKIGLKQINELLNKWNLKNLEKKYIFSLLF